MGLNIFKNKIILNLLVMLLLTGVLIYGILKGLAIYTGHNEYISVPNLTGLTADELDDYITVRNLRYAIIDSVYDPGKEKGSVFSQNPLPGSKVKKNRTIYLTIVSLTPEKVLMPDLKDLSLRQAMSKLETYGLKTGNLEYVPDIAQNAVLKQMYKGEEIEPGASVVKGAVIDLVLGEGLKGGKVNIPFLYGKTRAEAIRILKASSLNVGSEFFDEHLKDSTNVKVYKQNPCYQKDKKVFIGQPIDLYYSSDKYFNFNALLKQKAKDTIK